MNICPIRVLCHCEPAIDSVAGEAILASRVLKFRIMARLCHPEAQPEDLKVEILADFFGKESVTKNSGFFT